MDTRQKIMTEAVKLFSECGYHATTVDDIARAAEVAKGTVYWHFASKEELFEELLKEMFTRYLDEVLQISQGGGPVLEQLQKILGLRIALIRDNQPVTEMIMSRGGKGMSRESSERFLGWRRRHQEIITGLMREGKAQGELRIDSPEVAAIAFVGVGSELILSEQIHRPELARELMSLLTNGIAGQPARAKDTRWE